jgi:hypothetical protein
VGGKTIETGGSLGEQLEQKSKGQLLHLLHFESHEASSQTDLQQIYQLELQTYI